MHLVLHDWHDYKNHEILTHLKPAMTKRYNKLLINEHVIPKRRAHMRSTGLDNLMISLLTARERTEQQQQILLVDVIMRN